MKREGPSGALPMFCRVTWTPKTTRTTSSYNHSNTFHSFLHLAHHHYTFTAALQMRPRSLVSFMLYQQSLTSSFQMIGDVFSALTAAVGAADKVRGWRWGGRGLRCGEEVMDVVNRSGPKPECIPVQTRIGVGCASGGNATGTKPHVPLAQPLPVSACAPRTLTAHPEYPPCAPRMPPGHPSLTLLPAPLPTHTPATPPAQNLHPCR